MTCCAFSSLATKQQAHLRSLRQAVAFYTAAWRSGA